ncbi:3-deoxy-7-phosphoheptulonate synthase [Saccharopolyspora hattusasensis]|uniref:3-deoxy-7-phosphoheptulonate synthase n=1 Tax=Saccharopolyspora hattusasensis TaxID=1128679 RepID=UPI003D973333
MTNSELLASWRDAPEAHQPESPDRAALNNVLARLAAVPALVTPSACDYLRSRLAAGQSARE